MIELTTSPKKIKEIAWRIIDEEAILVLPEESNVKVLNKTGTRIWQLIDGTNTVNDIANTIHNEFHVDPKTSLEDTSEFIDLLKKNNLIFFQA